jgi:hypothetical protein
MLALLLLAAAADPAPRLTVSPAAAPRPALKYQLLPEVRELKPGNATQWYLRCFMEQRRFFFDKDSVAIRARQRVTPLKELNAEELRNYGGSATNQADYGARLDTADWQALERVQNDGADLRLPELPPLRELGVALQVRFRGEVARGEFDDALKTAKTMFQLAKHLGEYPALAGARTGQAVAEMALETLTELVQQPNAPNLYWALTDLPLPLVDLRKGAQGDRVTAETELRGLRADVAISDADVEELVGRVSGRVGLAREQAGKPPRNVRAELTARAKDEKAVAAARKRLADAGIDKAAGFSAMHVILLNEKLDYEERRDDELKRLSLKPWEADAKATGADGLFADLVPSVADARRAQVALERRVAVLRHVEALRMYAAGNGGRVPAALSAVGLPLPADPLSGKPFGYEVTGGVAVLSAPGLRVEVAVK